MTVTKTKPVRKRKGGVKKQFNTFISFNGTRPDKAALILAAQSRQLSFSDIGREMVREYIKAHKLEVPVEDVAEQIVREFSGN